MSARGVLALFSTGVVRAREVRSHMLEAMGAEPEWLDGDDRDETVTWVAGPLTTRFFVAPVDDAVPGLGVLNVVTVVGDVTDLLAARALVARRNGYASVNRWVVLGDPGPEDDVPDERARGSAQVCLECSFVVGDPAVELPMMALTLTVAGQISESTLLVDDEGVDGWGTLAAPAGGVARPREQWSPIVWFEASDLAPHVTDSPARLMAALGAGFTAARDAQLKRAPAVWYGSADQHRMTCEVPYGPGPFPMGMIGMRSVAPQPQSADTQTSLVQGFEEDNPRIGMGILLVMRLPVDPDPDRPGWWVVDRLNARTRMNDEVTSAGFAHGIGAWIIHDGEPTYTCLIPAGWQEHLSDDDMALLFRGLLENAARLSWDAHHEFESADQMVERAERAERYFTGTDQGSISDSGTPEAGGRPGRASVPSSAAVPNPWRVLPKSGLAAGDTARGLHFGEPGVGVDPGAQALEFAWHNLVGRDAEWAYTFGDGRGFSFWMGPATVTVTNELCGCPQRGDEAGSVVRLHTELGTDTPELRAALADVQAEGAPMAFVSIEKSLYAETTLHVHSDSLDWSRLWIVAIAVAHALVAEHLGPAHLRGVDLSTPNGLVRSDRDDMLILWADRASWSGEHSAKTSLAALLHALAVSINPGYSIHHDGPDTLSVDWWVDVPAGKDLVKPQGLHTRYGYVTHSMYGRCLRISTEVVMPAGVDVLALNDPDVVSDTFTLGGFHLTGQGAACTSLYPIAFDRSTSHPRHVGFAGTALTHHMTHVIRVLLSLNEVAGHPLSADQVAAAIPALADTYQAVGGTAADISLTATSTGEKVIVTWSRPWPYAGADTWPRIAAPRTTEAGQTLEGSVTLRISHPSITALRLIHAALALGARPNPAWQRHGSLLASLASAPTPHDIDLVVDYLTERGLITDVERVQDKLDERDLVIGTDVQQLITNDDGEPVASLQIYATDGHPAWGRALVIEAALLDDVPIPALRNTDGHDFTVGSWSADAEGTRYRICLPPFTFAAPNWAHRITRVEDLTESLVIGMRHVHPAIRHGSHRPKAHHHHHKPTRESHGKG